MKYLLVILTILFFCQCNSKKGGTQLEIKEIEAAYIDDSVKGIIKQYMQKYPEDCSIVLFFNLPADSFRSKEYGLADYFTLGEFSIPRFEAEIAKSYAYIPSCYFMMDSIRVYVVPKSNTLLTSKFTKDAFRANPWLKHFFDCTKHKAWLIQHKTNINFHESDEEYCVVNKNVNLFLGISITEETKTFQEFLRTQKQ